VPESIINGINVLIRASSTPKAFFFFFLFLQIATVATTNADYRTLYDSAFFRLVGSSRPTRGTLAQVVESILLR
jgi:hypothetical protein